MWKLRRPRKRCAGLTSGGREARDPDEVHTMFSERWAPIFEARVIDNAAAGRFLRHVVPVPLDFDWIGAPAT